MAPPRECPNCGEDISDTYEPADPSVGIMRGGWYCEECDEFISDDDLDDPDIDRS